MSPSGDRAAESAPTLYEPLEVILNILLLHSFSQPTVLNVPVHSLLISETHTKTYA